MARLDGGHYHLQTQRPAVSCASGHQPIMTCVASTGGVHFWRTDYEDIANLWEQILGWPYSWIWLSFLPTQSSGTYHIRVLGWFWGMARGRRWSSVFCQQGITLARTPASWCHLEICRCVRPHLGPSESKGCDPGLILVRDVTVCDGLKFG